MPKGGVVDLAVNAHLTSSEIMPDNFRVEPAVTALCHCTECQKWTGGSGSTDIDIPTPDFKLTKGTPKQFSRMANSGKKHTQYFCGTCGSNLFSDMEAMQGMIFVKAGSLDGGVTDLPVKIEFFVRNRAAHLRAVEGSAQFQTME